MQCIAIKACDSLNSLKVTRYDVAILAHRRILRPQTTIYYTATPKHHTDCRYMEWSPRTQKLDASFCQERLKFLCK